MSDTPALEMIELVRSRYAEAARSVLSPQPGSDCDCDCGPSCCTPADQGASPAQDTAGCCDTSGCCGGQYATESAALARRTGAARRCTTRAKL
jgi:hypothetical protein